MSIDLHLHSRKSDGSLSPTELVMAAKQAGLKSIALTDHDTVSGLHEAQCAGEAYDLEVISGCELTVESQSGILHILGLWVDHEEPSFQQKLADVRSLEKQRIKDIVSTLNSFGIDIALEDVQDTTQGQVSRVHVAAVLKNMGIVKSIPEAFEKFIGEDKPAYIPRKKMSAEEAISLLRSNGALSILAHPFKYTPDSEKLRKNLFKLKELGLQGIEAYYGQHSLKEEAICENLAKELGLARSGGSDFHGRAKPDISLGLGNMTPEIFNELKKAKFG